MKKCFVGISILIFSIVGCSTVSRDKKADAWLGRYTYSEPPVKAIAGYNMVMEWELTVNKIDRIYKSILNVSGQQTSFSLLGDLAVNDTALFVIYDKLLAGTFSNFQQGDTLFSLSRKGSGIRTRWMSLNPLLSEQPPKECNCFVFAGVNKDNNTLRIPR